MNATASASCVSERKEPVHERPPKPSTRPSQPSSGSSTAPGPSANGLAEMIARQDDYEGRVDHLDEAGTEGLKMTKTVLDSDFMEENSVNSEVFPDDWSSIRVRVAKLLSWEWFDPMMSLVIVANVGLVVRETDLGVACAFVDHCEVQMNTVSLLNNIFLTVYASELLLRIFVFRVEWFLQGWNMFDGVIVVAGIFGELFINGSGISVLRVVRLARLAKLVRLFVAYRELYLIMRGFISTAKTIFWAAFMLLILITVCSILCVEFLHPLNRELDYGMCQWCPRAFETVFQSNVTLFQIIICQDSWGLFAQPLIEQSPIAGCVLVLLVLIFVLGFSNLIMSVIIEKSVESRSEDERYQLFILAKETDNTKKKFVKLCATLDGDGNGQLSLNELMYSYDHNRAFLVLLKSMKVNKDDLKFVFEMLDSDQSGTVSYEEFADNLYKMKSADTTTMLMFIRYKVHHLDAGMKSLMREIVLQSQAQKTIVSGLREVKTAALAPPRMDSKQSVAGAFTVAAHDAAFERHQIDRRGEALRTPMRSPLRSPPPEVVDSSQMSFANHPADVLEDGLERSAAITGTSVIEVGSVEERFFELREKIQAQLAAVTRDTIRKVDAQTRALAQCAQALSSLDSSLPVISGLAEGTGGAGSELPSAPYTARFARLKPVGKVQGRLFDGCGGACS